MTTEGSEEQQESGGALRDNLEAAIAETKALKKVLAETTAGSFQYVKPEDLMDVAPNDLATKAAEIEQARATERQEVLKSELTARGWTEEQIEQTLAAEAPKAEQKREQTQNVQSALNGLGGGPPARPKPGEGEGLYGRDRIRASMGD